MAIDIRILSLLAVCSHCGLAGEFVRCARGEEVLREGVALDALTVDGPCRVVVRRAEFRGNRGTAAQGQALPPSDRRFADHFPAGNGLVVIGAADVVVEDSAFREIAGFAILASGVSRIRVARCTFQDSGSRNAKGRNNTTGGVLFEDGTANFLVEDSKFTGILGNGVWTHSRYMHTRNGPGVIRRNTFDTIGRDAVQVGHAWGVDVVENEMTRVGYPEEVIDVEGGGTPVGVDTAGNVDSSNYSRNTMTEINGKCFDLDGFHHGTLIGNRCVNKQNHAFGHFGIVMNNTNPDMQSVAIRVEDNRFEGMQFGGIFIIGSGHTIRRNTLVRLHMAHCSEDQARPGCTHFDGEPDLLRTGIYFGKRAERPATTRGNVVEGNTIRGWRMDHKCIGFAPGLRSKDNRVSGNDCRHEPD